jgi:aryl-alcohol dehydrogenase-like predicted oxidoreductase
MMVRTRSQTPATIDGSYLLTLPRTGSGRLKARDFISQNWDIKAAALQFSLAHPASAAVIPGASRPERIKEDHAALTATIPDDFWREMREQGLVAADAPLPSDR